MKKCTDCLSHSPHGKHWLHLNYCILIHQRATSLNNKRYFISFVDNYSRLVWVYFLEQKFEAFFIFLQFMAHVERESRLMIKGLRTYHGGEFISKIFLELLQRKRHKEVAY